MCPPGVSLQFLLASTRSQLYGWAGFLNVQFAKMAHSSSQHGLFSRSVFSYWPAFSLGLKSFLHFLHSLSMGLVFRNGQLPVKASCSLLAYVRSFLWLTFAASCTAGLVFEFTIRQKWHTTARSIDFSFATSCFIFVVFAFYICTTVQFLLITLHGLYSPGRCRSLRVYDVDTNA